MDNYQFVASLVSSLAWPVAVVIVVVVFRGPIGDMIGRLEHVKSPWFEGWAKTIEEARVVLAPSTNAVEAASPSGSLTEKFADLAADSPEEAVAMGWIEVDKRLRQKMIDAGLPVANNSVRQMTDAALQAGFISQGTATAIRKLSTLRLLATGGQSMYLDSAKAMDFLALADAAIFAIEHDEARRKR
ncbi:MAG: hypothetical protein ABSB34_07785 [Candidatus Limnocylindrales bacterium]